MKREIFNRKLGRGITSKTAGFAVCFLLMFTAMTTAIDITDENKFEQPKFEQPSASSSETATGNLASDLKCSHTTMYIDEDNRIEPLKSTSSGIFISSGTTLYVGGDGPGNYTKIQDAIDDASDGDTIFVYNGIYFEHVVVDKQLFVIGEDKNSTIIDGEGSEDVVVIDADNVTIENLKIINSGPTCDPYYCDSGIELYNTYYCEIRNCIFTENKAGLGFCSSSYNIIENCLFENNQYGIRAYGDLFAPEMVDDIGNQIVNNIIQSNTGCGIYFSHSWQYHRSNIIQGNIIANNGEGIYMILSHENEISYNTIVNNTGCGVTLEMCMCGGMLNVVHHNNFIGNNGGDVQAFDWSGGLATNYWYDQDDEVGNFWSDYTGPDSDGDGIGDIPYEIPDMEGSTNQDLYPLMEPWQPITTIYVDDDADPGWYDGTHVKTIQEGVNNATADDTVFVYNGTYYENVLIDKTVNICGEDNENTIIDGGGDGDVVTLTADAIYICNFTMRNSGPYSNRAGIQIYSSNNSINNNIISDNKRGIGIYSSSTNNQILDNIIGPSVDDGIRIFSSSGNIFSGNTISGNDDGIALSSSSDSNEITNNTIVSNKDCGIALSSSIDNIISGNDISDNNDGIHLFPNSIQTVISENNIEQNSEDGIYLSYSTDNEIHNNTISSNIGHGISLRAFSDGNMISENTISNNFDGVRLYTSSENTIRGNTFSNNYKGLRPYASSDDNLIYNNNFIGNTVGVHDTCTNQWDNGYPCGGNFWDDYTGSDLFTGPFQDLPGSDGIGDSAYFIHGGAVDHFPLMELWDGIFVLPPEVVYVDDDFNPSTPGWGYDKYNSIRDAMVVVVEHGEIFVHTGVYYENITIFKPVTIHGEDRNDTIISYSANGYGDVITINVPGAIIRDLWISSDGNSDGFKLNTDNASIIGNRVTNTWDAIDLASTNNHVILDNILDGNHWGIDFYNSHNNLVSGNTVINCEAHGMTVTYTNDNIISGNIVSNNVYGISIYDSSNITIFDNIFGPGNTCGLYLSSTASNNYIYHNDFINNNQNAYDEGSNIWDDGYPSGGNYWDDYTGSDEFSGPDQNISGSDGIGDIPYSISPDGNNIDSYPLMEPWSENPPFSIVYVDDDYDSSTPGWQIHHFDLIQDGIDAVGENGTVMVFNGTYYENLVIDKPLQLKGEDKANTFIDGSGIGDVVYISSDWVNIQGFTIQNSGSNDGPIFDAGIDIRSNYAIISGNILSNNYRGIFIYGTISNNIISGNNISDNENGIYCSFNSNNNSLYHNNFINNTQHAHDEGQNTWDHGYPFGGNYWDDYMGVDEFSGPGQNETDPDGIGDTPYSIPPDGRNEDQYPLMEPWQPITIVYVDDNYDDSTPGWQIYSFDKIQDGIEAIVEYGTVFVFNGTYYENVVVDKPIDLIGEEKASTVIDGNDSGDVVFLSADGVNIQGFTINDSGYHDPWDHAGIKIYSNYNTISDNIISNNSYGIYLQDYSEYTTILNNTISLSSYYGMDISRCNNISISNNTFSSNHYDGIHVWECNYITITGNSFFDDGLICGMSHDNIIVDNTVNGKPLVYLEDESDSIVDDAGQVILVRCNNVTVKDQYMSNLMIGIYLEYSDHCVITNNTLGGNDQGIQLRSSCNNTISNNMIDMCWYGIRVRSSSDSNSFLNNEISNADFGISISKSENHLILGNSINGNGSYYDGLKLSQTNNSLIVGNTIEEYDQGLAISLSYNNTFYHNNLIDNDENAYDSGVNSWDDDYPSGGNYWDDYTGVDYYHGPDQDIFGSDGIGDTSYEIPGGINQDRYPLMNPFVPGNNNH